MPKNNLLLFNKVKNNKIKKMLFVVILSSIIVATLIWNYFIENPRISNINIPESSNQTYSLSNFSALTPGDVLNSIENNKNKPILLFLYTTWCSACKNQFPIINEIARKFQNTDLEVMSIAIDRNINDKDLFQYLNPHKNIYFKPTYLLYQDGLEDLLKTKNIKFNKIIPLTVVINRNGSVAARFTGVKSENYLNRKIIKSLDNPS